MKKLLIVAAVLSLFAPALSQTGTFVSLKYYKWYINPGISSQTQPYKNAGGGLAFQFPVSPQPDPNASSPWYGYLIRPYGFPISVGPLTLTFQLNETGYPLFNFESESFNTCQVPVGVRFYVQTGDLYNSTAGTRWWSDQVQYYLQNAQSGVSVTLYVPLDPSQWSDQFGSSGSQNPGGWQNTFNSPTWIGVTFGGGCFFAHGGNVSDGTCEFALTNLEY